MGQIYTMAQSGKLAEAQVMVQQVLLSHPYSGKAHFVQAELYSRQGRLDMARESLATAEKYAPGLPFAKPEAIHALRAQLTPSASLVAKPAMGAAEFHPAPQASAPTSSAWLLPLLLTGSVMVGAYFLFRKRDSRQYPQQAAYADPGNLSGPQSAYPHAYPQQTGTGLGGRIMGGVATGTTKAPRRAF